MSVYWYEDKIVYSYEVNGVFMEVLSGKAVRMAIEKFEKCIICNKDVADKDYDGSISIWWISDPPVIVKNAAKRVCLCNKCFHKIFNKEVSESKFAKET